MSKKTPVETLSHDLVPAHAVLSDEAKQKVMDKYHLSEAQFPKILPTDPALRGLDAKAGDLIQIKRRDPTGEYLYYRLVAPAD